MDYVIEPLMVASNWRNMSLDTGASAVINQAKLLKTGEVFEYYVGSHGGRSPGWVLDDTEIIQMVKTMPTLFLYGAGNVRWIVRLRTPPITIIQELIGCTIICDGSVFVCRSLRDVKEYSTVLEACDGKYYTPREYYLEQELEETKKRLARLEAIVTQIYWAPGGPGAQSAAASFNTLRDQVSLVGKASDAV